MDVIEVAARWATGQPGWIERAFAQHVPDADRCAGCSSYRPVPWPCVLIAIAQRARELTEPTRCRRANTRAPSSGPASRGPRLDVGVPGGAEAGDRPAPVRRNGRFRGSEHGSGADTDAPGAA